MKESTIQKKSRDNLHRDGWYTFKIDSRAHKGIPDVCAIKNGTVRFIEFKAKDGTVSEIQKATHLLMRLHGANVEVISEVIE